MSNFIKNYIFRLRVSDEKTKHRSALTIAIIASVIILAVAFFLLKDFLFFPNKNISQEEVLKKQVELSEENKIESPLTSFANFFKDTAKQLTNARTAILSIPEAFKNLSEDGQPISTSSDSVNSENAIIEIIPNE